MAFPNVPNVPGVPALPRAAGAVLDQIILLAADAVSLFGGIGAPQWGLFKDGVPVVIADSVVSFDFKQDWSLPTYPLEKGAFETYNKVETPFGVRLRFATGGSDADREAMLSSLEAASASMDLFDAVTPEKIYSNVNINHQDFRRNAYRGNGLITIDVWCTEIRNNATAQFTSPDSAGTSSAPAGASSTTEISVRPGWTTKIVEPKSPGASPQVSTGTVQPVPAPSSFSDPMTGFQTDFQ